VPTRYSLFNLSIGKKGQQKMLQELGLLLDGFFFSPEKNRINRSSLWQSFGEKDKSSNQQRERERGRKTEHTR